MTRLCLEGWGGGEEEARPERVAGLEGKRGPGFGPAGVQPFKGDRGRCLSSVVESFLDQQSLRFRG